MEGGIFLLLGSNLGDRLANLKQARETIGSVIRSSAIYETAAWGKEDQEKFLNQAIEIKTIESPAELLKRILSIETAMGRERIEKWGTRLIDIDILFYKDKIIDEPELKVPHPEMQNRRFVLEPLAELARGFEHPLFHQTVEQLLKDCKDPLPVKRLQPLL